MESTKSKEMSNSKISQAVIVCSLKGPENIANIINDVIGAVGGTPDKKHDPLLTMDFYEMDLETKYYSGTIQIVPMAKPDLVSKEFAECVQGIIIHIDSDSVDTLNKILQWNSYEFEPSIRILCGNKTPEHKREDFTKWMIENGFEFVPVADELNLSDTAESESSDDDDYGEDPKSFKRIIQVLKAHIWPLIELKNRPKYKPSEKFQELLSREIENSMKEEASSGSQTTSDRVNPEEEKKMEEFERLFSNLAGMKEKADALSGDARRDYAEQVAMAFWNAISDEDYKELDACK